MKKFFALLISILMVNSPLKAYGDELSIPQLQKIIDEGKKITLEEEKRYGDFIRKLATKQAVVDKSPVSALPIYILAQEFRIKIREEFPDVSDESYKKSYNSIGIALGNRVSDQEKMRILIREARLLSAPAMLMLFIQYEFRGYNPEILAWIKEESNEGSPRCQFEYGRIMLNGIGIEKNEELGIQLMAKSEIPEANVELMQYYYEHEGPKSIKFEMYLRLAAEDESPVAMYNLAILEQENKNYTQSIDWFEKTLKIKPDYEAASLELARMYAEGWGVPKDTIKAIKMFEQLAMDAKDEIVKNLALENIRRIKGIEGE